LLNGSIYQAILKQPAAPFAEDLSRVDAFKDKVEILFLSILNRKPTKEELEICLDEIDEAKDETPDYSSRIPANISPEKKRKLLKLYAQRANSKSSYGMNPEIRGLAWTLLNTRQFSFIQ